METETQLNDGIFEGLFPRGRLASAFTELENLNPARSEHPELSAAECRFYAGLRFEKRRRDWLGGRLAAKRAVVRLAESSGADWRPQSTREVEVLAGTTREPRVYSPGSGIPRRVQVSISHSGQLAGAVACHADAGRIGFDLERLESIEPALYRLAFCDSEAEAIESTPAATRVDAAVTLWTAKEAVSKAIGTGLSICLRDIHLSWPSGFCRGSHRQRFSALVQPDGLHLGVDTCRIGDYVLSLAWLE